MAERHAIMESSGGGGPSHRELLALLAARDTELAAARAAAGAERAERDVAVAAALRERDAARASADAARAELGAANGQITERSLVELGDLADRLSAVQQSGVVTVVGGQHADDATTFERLISEADRQLDDLAVYRQARAAH